MTAEIHHIRDYVSKKEQARMQAFLEKQAMEIASACFPNVMTDCSQANAFHAPDKDAS